MEREATGEIEFGVLARHDNHRRFGIRAVVASAGLGHVDDRHKLRTRIITVSEPTAMGGMIEAVFR